MSEDRWGPREARAYLLGVAEPPAHALRAFVTEHGPVIAAERVRAGTVPARVADETSARSHRDRVGADFSAAATCGARLVTPEDEEWPEGRFAALEPAVEQGHRWSGAPLALWVRGGGRLTELTERAVAVVGARAATGYGEHNAAEFGYELARAGYGVVSGAAYGIDGAAHRGALAAGGATVAVLACGVDVAYPAGHADMLDRAASAGALVSEYPPGTPPARHRFLVRNRLIAALASGTVVVEAGKRSGARNTAATARALGREVLALPGPVSSAMSVGCHAMIRSGEAILVTSPADVLEDVGRIGEHLVPQQEGRQRPGDGLDGPGTRVYEALAQRSGRSPERIAEDSGVPLMRVRAVLPALELAGLAARCETGWRRARS